MIIQNGDIPYEDALGPTYAGLERLWTLPPEEMRRRIAETITQAEFQAEFLNAVRPELADRIPPDLWTLHRGLVTPQRQDIAVSLIAGLKEHRAWFPEHRRYLRDHRPPALIVWGPQDGYMPEPSARAYLPSRVIATRWRAPAAQSCRSATIGSTPAARRAGT